MKTLLLMIIFLVVPFISLGCNDDTIDQPTTDETTENPNPEERLAKNPNADIVMIDNITYINAEEVGREIAGKLTLGNKVLKVKVQSTDASDFQNGTASKLPVGTEIFEAAKPNSGYIALIDGEMRLYVSRSEG